MWLSRNENKIHESISFVIFIGCLFVCIFSTYSCLEKWLTSPIGTKLSTEFQTKVDLPTITFCPEFDGMLRKDKEAKPQAFNWTKMDDCGLNRFDKFIGPSLACQDPKTLWENMTPQFDDFGFISVEVKAYTDEYININTNSTDANWNKVISSMFGTCYSLTIPEEIKKKGVEYVSFVTLKNRQYNIFFHGQNLLNWMDPWETLDYIDHVVSNNTSYNVIVDYQDNENLDFDGKECQTDSMYSFQQCIQDEIQKVHN